MSWKMVTSYNRICSCLMQVMKSLPSRLPPFHLYTIVLRLLINTVSYCPKSSICVRKNFMIQPRSAKLQIVPISYLFRSHICSEDNPSCGQRPSMLHRNSRLPWPFLACHHVRDFSLWEACVARRWLVFCFLVCRVSPILREYGRLVKSVRLREMLMFASQFCWPCYASFLNVWGFCLWRDGRRRASCNRER